MLILLFLLFAEPVPNMEGTLKESDGSTVPARQSISGDAAAGVTTVPPGPGSPVYMDTLGVSSSPREISLVLGSPRSTWTTSGEKEDSGEILALTQMGLDCLVRFLIVSQAIQASNESIDSTVSQAANVILDIESQDIPNTETVNEKKRPLYTFAVRTANTNTPRVPLVTLSDAVLPLTLPVFLSMLCVPEEDSEKGSPFQTLNIDVPGTTADISSCLFTSHNLNASLSVFMDDMGELSVVAAKAIEVEKRAALHHQESITAAEAAAALETEAKILLAATAAQLPREDGTSSSEEAVKSDAKNKKNSNGSVPPDDVTRSASTSPSGAPRHRKINNRVITPSNAVDELTPASLSTTTTDAHTSDLPSLSLPPEDPDGVSIGSAGTGTTVDSLPNVDHARTLGPKTMSTNNMTSPTFSSSILAALSFSSHGQTGQTGHSTSNTQDSAAAIRARSNTNSTTVPSGLSPQVFYSSTCGLINLGNTCFMSSALQCLVHSPLVKDYFVSGKYKDHLNTRNPLGTKGVLTEEFAALIESMWRCAQKSKGSTAAGQSSNNLYKKQLRSAQSTPSSSSMNIDITSTAVTAVPAPCFAPHDFKRVLQTCKSQFQGHEQQDVQEFLAEIMVSTTRTFCDREYLSLDYDYPLRIKKKVILEEKYVLLLDERWVPLNTEKNMLFLVSVR